MHNVRLRVEQKEFSKYDFLKRDTFRLAHLMCTPWLWGVADHLSDLDSYTIFECLFLLKRLREFLRRSQNRICTGGCLRSFLFASLHVGGEGNDHEKPDVGTQEHRCSGSGKEAMAKSSTIIDL